VLVVSVEQQASWVRNFNPFLPPGMCRWPTTGGVYEPMFIWNRVTGEWVPWLATQYQWADGGRALVFTIREGVRWSDGTPMTARDVAFTFELMRRHRALDLQAVWGFLDAVEADAAARTVTFRFSHPYVPGLIFIAHQAIVPEHVWRDVADPVTFANETPIATGPFTEVELFRHQVYQLGRNPYYWQPGKPAVRSLRFPAYPGNDQANLALIAGEVDWSGNFVPAIDRIFVARDPAHNGYWFPLVGGTIALFPNTTRAPFDDVRVRKALSLAIDRDLLVEVAMYGMTRPADATALSDANARWRDPEAIAAGDWVGFDPEAAARLLDEAGCRRAGDGVRVCKGGRQMRFTVQVVTGWSDWVRAAEIVARSLDRIGIPAKVRAQDFGAWFDALQRGEFELSLGWTLEGPTPHMAYRGLMSKQTVVPLGQPALQNWHRFGSERADALLGDLERTLDPDAQRRIANELQREFVKDAPVIPLFLAPSWGSYSTRRFTGFPTRDDPYALLSPNQPPEPLLVMVELVPR
jgi:peptide/nickel transport system substrate-binding protein